MIEKYIAPGIIYPDNFLKWARKFQESCRFAEPVDLVYIGTCSAGKSKRPKPHTTNESGILAKGYFKGIPRQAKTVLVLSECCGQYNQKFQETLRRERPRVKWLFPDHFDYYGGVQIEKVVKDLLRAKILE